MQGNFAEKKTDSNIEAFQEMLQHFLNSYSVEHLWTYIWDHLHFRF